MHIGNPGGLQLAGSVTMGIISAVDRPIKPDAEVIPSTISRPNRPSILQFRRPLGERVRAVLWASIRPKSWLKDNEA